MQHMSEANIQRSTDECLGLLDGKEFLRLFQSARVHPKTPIATTISWRLFLVDDNDLRKIVTHF